MVTPMASRGSNFCLRQGSNVYASATYSSPKVGWVGYYDTWHHYSTTGNWSLGYVEYSSPIIRGYIPVSLLQYDKGNGLCR